MPAYALLALIYYTIAENDQSKLDLARAGLQAGARSSSDKDYAPIYNTLGLIKLRKKNVDRRRSSEFEQAVAARSEVHRGAPEHRRHRPVDAPVREGGGSRSRRCSSSTRRTSTRPSGMGVASRGLKKIDEAESWYKKAARARPARTARSSTTSASSIRTTRSTPDNANLNTAQGVLQQVSAAAATTDPKKVADAERRMKDIDDTFTAIEQQKKMEAELKAQQEEMEKQQKADGRAAEGAGGARPDGGAAPRATSAGGGREAGRRRDAGGRR